MSAQPSFYQLIRDRIAAVVPPSFRQSALSRLALLVTGILAARSAVLAQVAAELDALDLTDASPESIARRLRRALNDPLLTPATCYTPVLEQVLDWPSLLEGRAEVIVAVDDSSKTDQIHLLRASLSYRGGSLPLAWALWQQNVPQPQGFYWQQVDAVFAQVAALLPPGVRVTIVADRAFAVPAFLDRCRHLGWHVVVRVPTRASHRFRDRRWKDVPLRAVVAHTLGRRGRRWKCEGWLFKDAGWRRFSLVGIWGEQAEEVLLVLSDRGARWEVLGLYERRFWCEPGFRNDKTRGWRWEESQVQGVAHHEVLMLALAWASLVTLCLGAQEAERRVEQEGKRRERGCRGQPRHARESLFTLGLRAGRRWLYGTARGALRWRLGKLDGVSWEREWHQVQSLWLVFGSDRLAASNICSVRP
jgi:hypothetical protein